MPKNKKEEENSYVNQILGGDRSSVPSVTLSNEQFQQLTGRQSPYGAMFGSGSSSGSGSTLGLDLSEKYIKDIAKQTNIFSKEGTEDLYSTLVDQISRGSISKDRAFQEYMNAARYAGVKKPFSKANELAKMQQGFTAPSEYERFKPFMQLTAKDMLGRQFTENEMKGYTESARGLGISNPQDFAAFLGNTVLTSPEARSREVVLSKDIFKDTDTAKARFLGV